MTRIFGLNVFPEMLGLWLIETSVCFLIFYLCLSGSSFVLPGGSIAAGPPAFEAASALLLALTVGLVGFATGLYRPEVCAQSRWLLLKTLVSAAVSLPPLWLVAGLAGVGLPALACGHAASLLTLLLVWTALLFATRRL